MTDRISRIHNILVQKFSPSSLEITDESALHAGHAGSVDGTQTHLALTIRASAFADMSRVQRHRKIMAALDAEFQSGLHALRINVAPSV